MVRQVQEIILYSRNIYIYIYIYIYSLLIFDTCVRACIALIRYIDYPGHVALIGIRWLIFPSERSVHLFVSDINNRRYRKAIPTYNILNIVSFKFKRKKFFLESLENRKIKKNFLKDWKILFSSTITIFHDISRWYIYIYIYIWNA